jgi:two-component system response regulator NreC
VRATLLIADELTLVREGLAAICAASGRFEVVAECGDGGAALRLIEELRPDIAVLDFHLPDLFTLEVARKVRCAGLPTKLVVLSTRSDRKTVLEALRGGASAFLLKSGSSNQLLEAFDQVLTGGVYVSPLLAVDKVFFTQEKNAPQDPFDSLSPREFQVFSLLVEGVRAKEIAARLGLSPKTVDTYRASLMQKLEIFDVAGLVRFAMQRETTSAR